MSAMTPAAMPPNNAWAGEGGALASIEAEPIAFKLSNASSFNDFFAPADLNFYTSKSPFPISKNLMTQEIKPWP